MKSSRTKIFDLILSLVIALGAWGYVINVVNPPSTVTVRGVPVTVTGSDILTYKKLAIAGEQNYTVDVDLEGPRSELIGVEASDITASVDFSGLSAGQNYAAVSVTPPANLEVGDVRSQKIAVYVEELVTQDKPLNIVCSSSVSGYEPTILRYESDLAAVSGARSLVEMVSEVRVNLDVTTLAIDSPKSQLLEAFALDSEGNPVKGVTLAKEEVSVTASLYPVKTVPLELTVSGSPAYQAKVRSVSWPETIAIKGTSSRLASVDSISAGVINIEGISQGSSYTIVPELPTGVYLSETNSEFSAEVSLVDTGVVTFSYEADAIMLSNLGEGLEIAAVTKSAVTVTATSTLSIIKSLKAADLSPWVNLAALEEGTYTLPIESMYAKGDVGLEFAPSYIEVCIAALPTEEEMTETEEEAETPTDAEPVPED